LVAALSVVLNERDRYLIEARQFPDLSDREITRRLRSWLLIYRIEALRPPRHEDGSMRCCGRSYKIRDHVPSERLIRLVLAGFERT
jgi:hypothetical protein